MTLTCVAGLSEGLGLALFVPLLDRLTGSNSALTGPVRMILDLAGGGLPFPMLLACVTSLMLVSFALAAWRDATLTQAKFDYVGTLRARAFQTLLEADWQYLSHRSPGEVVNEALVEAHRAGNALTYQVLIVATLFQLIVYAGLSALLSWSLSVLVMALGVLSIFIIRPLLHRSRHLGEATNEANRLYGFHLVDYLKGIKLIRVTASEPAVGGRVNQFGRKACAISSSAEINAQLTHGVSQAIPVLIFAVILGLAERAGIVQVSIVLTFFLVMSRIAPRLTQLQQHYQGYLTCIAAHGAVEAAISVAEQRRESIGVGVGAEFQRLEHQITFDRVSLLFDADSAAVSEISLTIPSHSMVALVGASGAGKTTMIDLLAGLRRPTSGSILVDGVPLADWDLISWRRRLGYVTQDTIVFNDTLRNNISFAHPEADEDAIRHALTLANLDQFVDELPQGLDTPLNEGGVRLSGGQKQRLALARALVGAPDILLLDEATSALDNESERLVQQAIDSIAGHMTVVVVAHRLSTIRRADTIFVLDRGILVESGSFTELLGRGGHFSRLHGGMS